MDAAQIGPHGFGWIIANDQRWDCDILITTQGQVVARPKQLSKKYGGWHTVLGPEEVECAIESNPEVLLIGCGHFGLLPIRRETRELLSKRGVPTEITRLPQAIESYVAYARKGRRATAILHVTC